MLCALSFTEPNISIAMPRNVNILFLHSMKLLMLLHSTMTFSVVEIYLWLQFTYTFSI